MTLLTEQAIRISRLTSLASAVVAIALTLSLCIVVLVFEGRVEETVRGIKGNNCEKVTETINSQLGEVVATRPTEEMFEQEVKVDQTLYETDWNGGSSSW